MATTITELTMSLDGFIADPSGGTGDLFHWYYNGMVPVPAPGADITFRLSEPSATHLRDGFAAIGAIVVGRRTFDITDGFADGHPYGAPIFVVTHQMPPGWPRPGSPITIVTDGVVSAGEQAVQVAKDGMVSVAAASIARQCLEAGLLDEVWINLVPVLLGRGTRFVDFLAGAPVRLQDPRIVAGREVTHLYYRVYPS
jgi:dihydrofolate reductase